jgi:hypothetical protein
MDSSCRGSSGLGGWWLCKWLHGWKDGATLFLVSWVPFDAEAPSLLDGRGQGKRGGGNKRKEWAHCHLTRTNDK